MIAFYISGHGFGHASRDIEIINALATRAPGLRILLRTSVARWLLRRTITAAVDLDDRPCDTGVIQLDSLRLDPAATIARAREFYATLDARAAEEAARLTKAGVRLVLADAPPLACAAAAAASVPAVVIGNFTWDWIYEEYAEQLGEAPRLIETIQRAYRHAEAAWRLPMHGGFAGFDPREITDLPFVARHARHDEAETRARLGLPAWTSGSSTRGRSADGDRRRLALVSFGGFGIAGLDLNRLDCFDGWDLVITGLERPGHLPAHVHFFAEEEIYDAGVRYEDVVRACDAVVTKPGYGIIAECIANDTALVYTSRGRFREYPVLVRELPRYLRSADIDQDALFAGRWRDALDRATAAPAPPERARTDGAEVIADMILARMSGGRT